MVSPYRDRAGLIAYQPRGSQATAGLVEAAELIKLYIAHKIVLLTQLNWKTFFISIR